MRPALALLTTSAAALLLAAAWNRREVEASLGLDVDPFAPTSDWIDEMNAALAGARNAIMPTPVADMRPSDALRDVLKESEQLRLARYRLGDGGYTIGWGRYYADGGPLPPERIDRATADAWFDEDLEARGARWVRAYVSIPLHQHQFDALTHMAYNLRPSSFKTIAEAVNAGQDPEAAAMKYIRAGTHLEAGLRNRRGRELAMFREGIYA
jgi:lysozyme